MGDGERIEEWLGSCGLSPDDPVHFSHDVEYTALAKALIWQGRTAEALRVLTRLQELARSQGRSGKLSYVLALQSLALKQAGCMQQALEALRASLKLAQPGGVLRPYLDEGEPVEELLRLGEERGMWKQDNLDGFVRRLLQAIRKGSA